MSRLRVPVVCLVTDRRAVQGALVAAVVRAIEGGVNLVQVREKDLAAGELLELVSQLQAHARGRALVVVNDRADVALAAGADGVHLPGDGLPIAAARRLVGGLLVGRSVHTAEEAGRAADEGADYVLLGTVFPSRSHPGGPTGGLEAVRRARAHCRVPLVAIGGITAENAASVMEAGAEGVAVISAVLSATDPARAAEALRLAVEEGWARGRGLAARGTRAGVGR